MESNTPLPGFLIIGAQKCGTSWLHQQLSGHPDLFLPASKELEFFSYEPHLADPGIERYQEHFFGAQGRLGGEATPSYFWSWSDSAWCNMPEGFQSNIPRVVNAYLGHDVRLILCLRNPVERAVSAWGHYMAHGELDPSMSFREACLYGGIVDMGFYARHLSRWLEYFPAEQIMILRLEEDIKGDPERALTRTCQFLGVEDFSSYDESIKTRVFPGPEKVRQSKHGKDDIKITLESMGIDVLASASDLEWLTGIYRSDQQALSELLARPFRFAD